MTSFKGYEQDNKQDNKQDDLFLIQIDIINAWILMNLRFLLTNEIINQVSSIMEK